MCADVILFLTYYCLCVLLEMYILPVIGSGADADNNGMPHVELVSFIHTTADQVSADCQSRSELYPSCATG